MLVVAKMIFVTPHTHHVLITAEGLFDKGRYAGEQRVESPVVAEIAHHNGPDRWRGQDAEPRSLHLQLRKERITRLSRDSKRIT